MSENISELLEMGAPAWRLPEAEARRQAIPAIRGYAYQLHATLAAWLRLPSGAALYLEAAEDYAEILRDPSRLEAVLTATQVKDTRESGSVTLNSADVKDAVRHYWTLRGANTGRRVQFVFMTTSPVGREARPPMEDASSGLIAWAEAAAGGDIGRMRRALAARFVAPATPRDTWTADNETDAEIGAFLASAGDDELRDLLAGVTWMCGAPSIEDLEADNVERVIELGDRFGAVPELSRRAAGNLLLQVLSTILDDPRRRLTRAQLLSAVESLVTVRVPAQVAMRSTAGRADPVQALVASGSWRTPSTGSIRARRGRLVRDLRALAAGGALWLHGATGLGKTTLAELVAADAGGAWRLLDLRDLDGPVAAERLQRARLALALEDGLTGVLVDDVPTQCERELEAPLADFRSRLNLHGQLLLLTSRNPPGRRLAAAASISGDALQAAPPFDEGEVAELVTALGGDPATWARFVRFAGGGGHPQLVDVVAHGLRARGWPPDEMQRWLKAGAANPDVEAERDAVRRRLLAELDADTYSLLIRTTRIIGVYDRSLALAVADAPPPLADGARHLDRLLGHWIEQLGHGLMRSSPLVGSLAQQMLPPAELRALDRKIAGSILERGEVSPGLADSAAMHASLARADDLLGVIASHVTVANAEVRTQLATAMPLFRMAGPGLAGEPPRDVRTAILVRLAQHLLFTAADERDQVSASVAGLMAVLDLLQDPDERRPFEALLLMKVLIDEHAAGRLPEAFELIDRLETLRGTSLGAAPPLIGPDGEDPVAFAFVLHAVQGSGLAHLEATFDYLERSDPERRRRRLAPFEGETHWMGLAIDNAWMQEEKRGTLDGRRDAQAFRRLAERALVLEQPFLAARAFRAQAVLLDEYAGDRAAAEAALDAAEAVLPGHVMLRRERAKIAWRAKSFEAALEMVLELRDQLGELEPLEAAFVLREAGQSAGELGRWALAADLFEEAAQAAARGDVEHRQPMILGLRVDAAASRFAAGERSEGVRSMARALEDLETLDPTESRQAHFVHLIGRHVTLWMTAQLDPSLRLEGEPIAYVAGAASNPDPAPAAAERPVTPMHPAWWMLGRVALDLGFPVAEIMGWPGVQAKRLHQALQAENVSEAALLCAFILRAGKELPDQWPSSKNAAALAPQLATAVEKALRAYAPDWQFDDLIKTPVHASAFPLMHALALARFAAAPAEVDPVRVARTVARHVTLLPPGRAPEFWRRMDADRLFWRALSRDASPEDAALIAREILQETAFEPGIKRHAGRALARALTGVAENEWRTMVGSGGSLANDLQILEQQAPQARLGGALEAALKGLAGFVAGAGDPQIVVRWFLGARRLNLPARRGVYAALRDRMIALVPPKAELLLAIGGPEFVQVGRFADLPDAVLTRIVTPLIAGAGDLSRLLEEGGALAALIPNQSSSVRYDVLMAAQTRLASVANPSPLRDQLLRTVALAREEAPPAPP